MEPFHKTEYWTGVKQVHSGAKVSDGQVFRNQAGRQLSLFLLHRENILEPIPESQIYSEVHSAIGITGYKVKPGKNVERLFPVFDQHSSFQVFRTSRWILFCLQYISVFDSPNHLPGYTGNKATFYLSLPSTPFPHLTSAPTFLSFHKYKLNTIY